MDVQDDHLFLAEEAEEEEEEVCMDEEMLERQRRLVESASRVRPAAIPATAEQEEEGEEALDAQVILSVVYQHNRLGVAAYNTETSVLSVCEACEFDDFANLQLIKFQLEPSLIITPPSPIEAYIRALQKSVEDDSTNYHVKTCKSSEFSFESAKHKLLKLKLPGLPENLPEHERLLCMSSFTDLNNIQMVVNELDDADSPVVVNQLISFSIDGTMMIDPETMKALQIFQSDRHPSAHGIGKAKEGLSLYALFKTRTPLGRDLLRRWFLRPLLDQETIQRRQSHVEALLDPKISETFSELTNECLKHVKDIPRILNRVRSASSSANDWFNLFQTLVSALRIRELCAPHSSIPLFQEVCDAFGDDLYELVNMIRSVIDFDESRESRKLYIRSGISKELDQLRSTYQSLDELLTSYAKREMMQLADPLVTCLSVVYYPQIGYQVVIPRGKAELESFVSIPGLIYQFHTSQYIYFKSEAMFGLDHSEEFGDIWQKITDLENAIILELEEHILEFSPLLLSLANILAELDCLVSFAVAARENNWTAPDITTDSTLWIKNGRHPLQELCVETFIANNSSLDNAERILLLSGANGSGKSVYLKQVGLITFLAHVGSFVPAEESTIGLTDRIFSRIYSRESVAVQSSSFMIDLQQVALMIRHATDKSLLLLDEFGKGTSVSDGISLLGATLKYLQDKGNACPKVVVSSHFSEFFPQIGLYEGENVAPSSSSTRLAFYRMDVFVREDSQDKDVVFLYKLVRGMAMDSHAYHVGSLAGIPDSILKRAATVKDKLRRGEPLQSLDETESEAAIARRALHYENICRSFIALDLDNITPQQIASFIQSLSPSSSTM
ncbi:MutS protein 5 [Balamuthia mandrillaris]